MESVYFQDELFNNITWSKEALPLGEYEQCTFTDCDFSNADLSHFQFVDCTFDTCNWSSAETVETVFRDAVFKNCKMLGMRFHKCNQFGLSFRFEHCILNHSSFYRTKIKKTVFRHCQMQEVDFTECELAESTLEQCDLSGAVFTDTNLQKADLRSSRNFHINPELNSIKKAKFSLSEVAGLLRKYEIYIDPGS